MAQIYTSSTSPEVAKSVASFVLKHQDEALAKTGTFKIAVSGGSMGKVLKAGLVDNAAAAGKVQWEKWEIFFSDERLVPLDHADSNYGLLNESVLKFLTGAKPTVHTIDASLLTGSDGQIEGADEQKDEAIAKAYAEMLPADGKVDLVLLGCGPDGHTCSLFPGHALLKENEKRIALIRDSPKPPPRRISFTFPVLANAGAIAFIAEGEGKAPVINEIFNDAQSELPCKLVNGLGVPVSWFVNDAALTGISVPASKY
ncbi:6-phosphogluconolactonase [Metschnikowia bicuspidata var. bicuspidata NRRL YB-4993]|uniref:6-phosphogluconolactonase-like protein n=1 Tax=Metschnikowia bicuspidata var. bicuspidata NRRL YB-4993 TaxID=869754 RepID=A0A1A0HCB0_9ASCO|nr:6-phosphogluconolactonase [Metschnikowia bicuspidata var. bicuspidata NRRL YB-4993]OBA21512.1 6-phosphogluconolactonase [Metschnikowia bicuspidata var. bicuspidata NRRL YB-4993]